MNDFYISFENPIDFCHLMVELSNSGYTVVPLHLFENRAKFQTSASTKDVVVALHEMDETGNYAGVEQMLRNLKAV